MLLAQTTQPAAGFPLLELFSLVASSASFVLAIVAIWLTLKLYHMSNQVSSDTKESVGSINSNVAKLDERFRDYHKETVTDARRFQDKTLALLQRHQPTAEEAAAQEKQHQEEKQRLIEGAAAGLRETLDATVAEREKAEVLLGQIREAMSLVAERTREATRAELASGRHDALMVTACVGVLQGRFRFVDDLVNLLRSAVPFASEAEVDIAIGTLVKRGVVSRPAGSPPMSLETDPQKAQAYLDEREAEAKC